MKIDNKVYQKIKSLWVSWITLLVWFVLFLIIIQTAGIVVHEFGHYSTGKIFGCENLSISIAKLSWGNSISNVSGWESCSKPLVLREDGSRICNTPTNIISFAGLLFTLIVFIPLIFLINTVLKKKFGKFYLKGKYFVILLIFVIFMGIQSASFDLFKIAECFSNTNNANIVFNIINLLPKLTTMLVFLFICIDLIMLVNLLFTTKQGTKKEKKHK